MTGVAARIHRSTDRQGWTHAPDARHRPAPTCRRTPGWSHEVKWDGVRVLADTTAQRYDAAAQPQREPRHRRLARAQPQPAGRPRPAGRRRGDRAQRPRAPRLPGAPGPDARPQRGHRRPARGAAAGDVHGLRRDAASTARTSATEPLGERRKILRGLGLEHSTWQVPDAYDDGPMLFDATLQQGLEGIVSKRLTSRYVFGERTRNWLKFAHRHRRSYVVGGWRPQEGTTDRLAALLVGEVTEQGLALPRPGRQRHRRRGQPGAHAAGRPASPAATARSPTRCRGVDARGTFWVEPVLVVDVETHGVGYARLRQPSYRGRAHRPDPRGPVIAERRCDRRAGAGRSPLLRPRRRRRQRRRDQPARRWTACGSSSARAPSRWSRSTTPAATGPG